ncbi:MAG: acetate kinase [Succinivibrionaceae bacterium]|nr:acetate kinase [Succinivibrionaceae bacterium]
MDKQLSKTALVINCGSSSVKFAIIDPEDGHVFLSGLAEALNLPSAQISWRFGDEDKQRKEIPSAGHDTALEFLVQSILAPHPDLLASIIACGHRIVQGGDIYSEPTLVDDTVEANIEKCVPFAPLHNPAHLLGIRAARKAFPSIPHVVVFDTAFHQTMPPKAYRFAIPEEYYTRLHLRRYGAHGTSHWYLTQEAAKMLGKDVSDTNLITCHLGNGASVSAVKGGKCVDTSMGLTPLDGLVMGTRTGAIDPSVVFFLCEREGLTPEQVKDIFNQQSGLKALTGVSSDMRDICKGYAEGNERCILAMDIFCYRLAKTIASYYVAVGRVDAIVFAGGIGENCAEARVMTCDLLEEPFGIKIDKQLNEKAMPRFGFERGVISLPESSTKLLMIATNEELVIARSAVKFVK